MKNYLARTRDPHPRVSVRSLCTQQPRISAPGEKIHARPPGLAWPGLAWQAWSHRRRDLLPVPKIVPLVQAKIMSGKQIQRQPCNGHAAVVPVYRDKNQKVSPRQVLDTDRDH